MKRIWTMWSRELAAYFFSPMAYVVMIFFLVVMGFSFWLLATVLSQGVRGGPVMNELFASIFFWLTILITIPVVTMRLIAEEKKAGTLETLLTAPVRDSEVVLAKYLGALSFYIVLWLPTLSYIGIMKFFEPPDTPIDLGPMVSGYIGALLVGALYLAVGLFTSSLARNQIVAAIGCFAICCVLFLGGFLPYLVHSESVRDIATYLSSVMYMMDASRGVVDTRGIVFHLSGIVLMLFLSVKVLEWRRVV
ncbi:MAG: ABC transporter permease [Verrucomicrobia bacterium]|nr:MAG: ABC transporter permease [Verrucomicrobiota bacterium]